MVTDQIFPAIPKIAAKEPAVLMAILGIYERIFSGFTLAVELWARTSLPFLVFSSVDMSLNQDQYLQYVNFIEKVHNKVKEEHLKKLSTMSSDRDAINQGSGVLSAKAPQSENMSALDSVFNPAPTKSTAATSGISKPQNNTGVLSLEDKRRLAQQQETNTVTAATSTASAFDDPLGKSKKVPMNQMKSSSGAVQPTINTDWMGIGTTAPPRVSPTPASIANSAYLSGFGAFTGAPALSATNQTFAGFDPLFQAAPSVPTPAPMQASSSFGNLGGFGGGGGGIGLPQPPRSQNSAIQRKPQQPGSSLDNLFNFGPAGNKMPMNQMGHQQQPLSNGQPTMNFDSLGSLTLNPTKAAPPQKPASSLNDPFADLMS